jgi:hypothetical protein
MGEDANVASGEVVEEEMVEEGEVVESMRGRRSLWDSRLTRVVAGLRAVLGDEQVVLLEDDDLVEE